jgi:cytochrome c oxidase subunit I
VTAPQAPLTQRLAALGASDKRLVKVMIAVALLALALGIAAGVFTALLRAGFIAALPNTGYRALTLHGVAIFFYWLFIAQAALLLCLSAVASGQGIVRRRLAWIGFALMGAGLVASLVATQIGVPLLYNGAPELAADDARGLVAFNLGYTLLGLGLVLLPAAALATLLAPSAARAPRLSAVGFALFAWAGFLMVTGLAALYAFVPGLAWALGLAPFPADHGTRWHIVFHNLHYLPLMATVILWYVLVQALTGVKSAFGERFSKIVFAMYLVFVPPTSLYHMFLEPDLPGAVRVAGSLLSLFVSVPTLTAFLIIVASLEIHARAQGARGLFGWLRLLPWHAPAMHAMAVAMLSMGFGLALAFVLIQERLAPLLSDTFFVPAYFHFFTLGTVSMTLLAALAVVLPALGGRALWRPALLRALPWLAFAGLLLFGAAGIAAGYLGVPRRVMDLGYQGQAPALWPALMAAVALGGSVMAAGLALLAGGIALSLRAAAPSQARADAPVFAWPAVAPQPGVAAWTGPLAVLVIVLAMGAFTALGFELMRALPIASSAGGGGH